MADKSPYVSIVISSRNDEYQGGSLARFQLAIDSLTYQAKKYGLNAEVIIVEWNPPAEKPLLKDVLLFPKDLGNLSFRFILVPNAVHKRYKGSDKINIIKGPDWNVGIRRARGQFVFATNSDILFSKGLIQFMALGNISKDFFYRANRFDVDRKVMHINNIEKVDNFCRENIIASYPMDNTSHHGMREHPNLHINGGDFILFAKEYWELIHGWPELNNIGLYSDGLMCYIIYMAGLKERVLKDNLCVYHIDHDSRWKEFVNPKIKFINFLKEELYIKSNNIKFKTLIRNTRHLSDRIAVLLVGKGTNKEDRGFDIRRMRLNYQKTLIDILKKKRSYIYNDNNWGHPKEKFKEFIITSK